jgi:nucleoside-triphosphatase THEP1
MGLNWKGDARKYPYGLTRQHLLASFVYVNIDKQANNMTASQHTELLAVSLLSGEHKLTVLTGPRGAGKTTFCRDLIAQVYETSALVGGFICPAVFEGDKKVGIDMINVGTGERRRLGERSQNKSETTVGCWQLNEKVITWGNKILAKLEHDDIVIIDELGPLELEEGYGFREGLRLLDECRYRAALVVVRPTLVRLARLRWPTVQVLDLERGSA